MVSELCRDRDPGTQLEALLHNAAAAYVGEPPEPLQNGAPATADSLRDGIRATCRKAAGLADRHGRTSHAVNHAETVMTRYEAGPPFGFETLPTWYAPLTETETARVENAVKVIGQPRPGSDDAALHQGMFTERLSRLLPENAPLRRSVENMLDY